MTRLSYRIVSAQLIALLVMSCFFVQAQFRNTRNPEAQAEALMREGDFEGALAQYDQVAQQLKANGGDPVTLLNRRAYCLYSLGRNDEALADINRYLEKFADDRALLLRSYIYGNLNNTTSQLNDLDKLLLTNPDNTEMLRVRASVLLDAERYTAAQRDIKAILRRDDSPEVKAFLGLSYYYLDNIDSAFIIFDAIIADTPNFPQTYLYAGSLALEAGQRDMALQYIDQGLAVDPENTTLLFYKGVALVQDEEDAEKIRQGCRCLTRAFNAGEDDAAGYLKQYCYGVD